MVNYDSMGPSLQIVRSQFLDFLLSKLSRDFKLYGMSIYHITELSKGYISLLLKARVTWFGILVVLYVLCMMI